MHFSLLLVRLFFFFSFHGFSPSHHRRCCHHHASPPRAPPWLRRRVTVAFSLRFPANHSPFGRYDTTIVFPIETGTKALKQFHDWPPSAAAAGAVVSIFRRDG